MKMVSIDPANDSRVSRAGLVFTRELDTEVDRASVEKSLSILPALPAFFLGVKHAGLAISPTPSTPPTPDSVGAVCLVDALEITPPGSPPRNP